jgi:hypothetical protein
MTKNTWLEWQEKHVLVCEDFPEGTYSRPHTIHDLLEFTLPGGKTAFVCLSKAYANAEGLSTQPFILDASWRRRKRADHE